MIVDNKMKEIILITFLSFFISSISFSQSKLPKCKGTDVSKFNNCFGTYTFPDRAKYVGEFRDGKMNGKGTYTLPLDLEKYEGEFKDNKKHGQGTLTFLDGYKLIGEFKDGDFVRKKYNN
jgi:hypothetical protein